MKYMMMLLLIVCCGYGCKRPSSTENMQSETANSAELLQADQPDIEPPSSVENMQTEAANSVEPLEAQQPDRSTPKLSRALLERGATIEYRGKDQELLLVKIAFEEKSMHGLYAFVFPALDPPILPARSPDVWLMTGWLAHPDGIGYVCERRERMIIVDVFDMPEANDAEVSTSRFARSMQLKEQRQQFVDGRIDEDELATFITSPSDYIYNRRLILNRRIQQRYTYLLQKYELGEIDEKQFYDGLEGVIEKAYDDTLSWAR